MKIYSIIILIVTTLTGLGNMAYAGTASNVFNFTATFIGGSCEISAPSKVQFNDGNPFSSTDIEQQISATQQEFEINLTNCIGLGLTPKIKVSGNQTTDLGQPLFLDPGNELSAKGYGILLSSQENRSFESNSNLAYEGVISAKNWTSDMKLSTIDTTLKLVASLRCGDCNYAARQGGELKAIVTFDFIYE